KTKFVLSALLLFLLLPGCATLDVFPGGPEAIWFSPGKTASLESATSDIKNLLGSVKFDGCDATNIDIDKHGMRVSISCTETVVSTSTGTAEYYSGNFFENLFGPSETSDSTTEQQVQVQKSRIFSVAFADINDITLGAGNWVYISMKSGKTLVTQADTEYDAKK